MPSIKASSQDWILSAPFLTMMFESLVSYRNGSITNLQTHLHRKLVVLSSSFVFVLLNFLQERTIFSGNIYSETALSPESQDGHLLRWFHVICRYLNNRNYRKLKLEYREIKPEKIHLLPKILSILSRGLAQLPTS